MKERVKPMSIWNVNCDCFVFTLMQFYKTGIRSLNVSENVFSSKWLSAKP